MKVVLIGKWQNSILSLANFVEKHGIKQIEMANLIINFTPLKKTWFLIGGMRGFYVALEILL
ncbi:hypothetical protein A8F95_19985 [Bacillus wudalianchiensis]|uniref:Uncharacterized protein n=1 Tax=Pseudobacillus wudalianchiensis TaxID=1743143 RepID=A0A1B9B6U2_9BACI|nr:hypothetical protein A8F95_19985 [Bacillus wudalianchiensis]